ncbi:putative Clp, repeat (R) domain, P-loop containing nucleoside triphosphate hydrolase [Helianthus annuus]|nr:putative Clp, repeat (R) domain, P-loop containing nucleoside triphosphate hydrolase [Helianthus annuus]
MRSGLSTILQTLTPEAAAILTHSIAEAGRRNHNQTTPLHVAATLLAAPAGFLRQACIRSHPNSSHPLQCRALELCFSVALERLTSASSAPAVAEPPVSNALMAALKRAQAHQRRGCPEQQQQPLLAVKVELEQLIVSILDDPSVSRVMREASFSSPAVKATIEKSLLLPTSNNNRNGNTICNNNNNYIFRALPGDARNIYYNNQRIQKNDENLYMNPRLQVQQVRMEDVNRVIEIMSKSKKRNPVLVGEFEPESVKKEILMRVKSGEFLPSPELKNVEVMAVDFSSEKLEIPVKIRELRELVDCEGGERCIVVDLGDLKWVVEAAVAVGVDLVREAVAEMAKIVMENCRVWLIGTATCETYLRCQVYHPSMESDWDLQALPVSSRTPISGRLNSFNIAAQTPPPCCPKCYQQYEQELEKSSVEAKSDLPQWLQNAKAQRCETDSESGTKPPHGSTVNDKELMKKWSEICSRIHPNHNQIPSFGRMGTGLVPTYTPNMFLSQTGQQQEAPPSPVRTDLVLGPKEVHEDLPAKDYLGCISSEPRAKGDGSPKGKLVNSADAGSFKKLLKGLMKMAWWQPEAASTIATTVTRCSRSSLWLLFAGPDRVGKKKMASVLAEHVCGTDPITICLGSRRDEVEMDCGLRGKTMLDRIVDAVRRNPFSVIVLSDIDEADMLVRGSIKEAMKRGRLTDSYGREISLGNIIFVLTGNWSTNNGDEIADKWPHSSSSDDWRLKLTICKKRPKRRADWLSEVNSSPKQQKKVGSGLSLDLNLAVDTEEERTDTSDLTIEQGDENPHFASTSVSVPHELAGPSDVTVMFKPVQFGLIRHEIEKTIKTTFSTLFDEKLSIEVDEATIDNIVSGLWFGRTGLEDWAEQVLVPSLHKLVGRLPSSVDNLVVRLESDCGLDQANHGRDRLPSIINVIVDTV